MASGEVDIIGRGDSRFYCRWNHSLNQREIRETEEGRKKHFGPMDSAVKALSRRDRIEQSQREFEQLVEGQLRKQADSLSQQPELIEESGQTGSSIEPVKEDLPTETIVKKTSIVDRLLRFFVRDLRPQRERKNIRKSKASYLFGITTF